MNAKFCYIWDNYFVLAFMPLEDQLQILLGVIRVNLPYKGQAKHLVSIVYVQGDTICYMHMHPVAEKEKLFFQNESFERGTMTVDLLLRSRLSTFHMILKCPG